jgi:hypothetical protein
MHTVFNKETRFTTNFNNNNMAPIIKKNIVFEIVDDLELDINTDDEKKTNENKNKNNRRGYERHEALSDDDTEILDEILERKREREVALPSTIFRFKFTEEFMEELHNFSKIHQYDHRKDFKDAWVKWTEENQDIIAKEVDRLVEMGYPNEDDIVDDKMFKSARYYFRKKSAVKPEPKQRRQYIGVDHELLETMDIHIKTNIYNDDYKPKTAFVMFCKEYESILRQTIEQMSISDAKMIQDKIKKTYKNRYFMLTNK